MHLNCTQLVSDETAVGVNHFMQYILYGLNNRNAINKWGGGGERMQRLLLFIFFLIKNKYVLYIISPVLGLLRCPTDITNLNPSIISEVFRDIFLLLVNISRYFLKPCQSSSCLWFIAVSFLLFFKFCYFWNLQFSCNFFISYTPEKCILESS